MAAGCSTSWSHTKQTRFIRCLLEARVVSGRSLLEAAARAEICSITPNICSITPNAAEMASEGVMGIADQQAE